MKRWRVSVENGTGYSHTERFWTRRAAQARWLFLLAEGGFGGRSGRRFTVTVTR